MTIAATSDWWTCSNCGGLVEFDWSPNVLNWSVPNRSGVWVHMYAPHWGRQMTCDPQKVREAATIYDRRTRAALTRD